MYRVSAQGVDERMIMYIIVKHYNNTQPSLIMRYI